MSEWCNYFINGEGTIKYQPKRPNGYVQVVDYYGQKEWRHECLDSSGTRPVLYNSKHKAEGVAKRHQKNVDKEVFRKVKSPKEIMRLDKET